LCEFLQRNEKIIGPFRRYYQAYIYKLHQLLRFLVNQSILSATGITERLLIITFSVSIFIILAVGENSMGSTIVVKGETKIDGLQDLLDTNLEFKLWFATEGYMLSEFKGETKPGLVKSVWEKYIALNIHDGSMSTPSSPIFTKSFDGSPTALLGETNSVIAITLLLCRFRLNLRLHIAVIPYSRTLMGLGFNINLSQAMREIANNA
jgi:hypothetical protein